jgi:hypothetical protein
LDISLTNQPYHQNNHWNSMTKFQTNGFQVETWSHYGWKWVTKVSRIHKYPYTCTLINVISLKISDPKRKVLGVFEYHIHQRQHIIKVYAQATNHKHMLFQAKTLSLQLSFNYHASRPVQNHTHVIYQKN